MRMQVDHARQDVLRARHAERRRRVGRGLRQVAARVPFEQHVALPALGQQRVARK